MQEATGAKPELKLKCLASESEAQDCEAFPFNSVPLFEHTGSGINCECTAEIQIIDAANKGESASERTCNTLQVVCLLLRRPAALTLLYQRACELWLFLKILQHNCKRYDFHTAVASQFTHRHAGAAQRWGCKSENKKHPLI